MNLFTKQKQSHRCKTNLWLPRGKGGGGINWETGTDIQTLLLLLRCFSHVRLCATPQTAAHQTSHPWDSPGKNTGVGCHFLLQCMKLRSLSRVRLLATPWTAAHQAPLSMGFSRQEYGNGLPFPPPKYVYIHA